MASQLRLYNTEHSLLHLSLVQYNPNKVVKYVPLQRRHRVEDNTRLVADRNQLTRHRQVEPYNDFQQIVPSHPLPDPLHYLLPHLAQEAQLKFSEPVELFHALLHPFTYLILRLEALSLRIHEYERSFHHLSHLLISGIRARKVA